MSDFRFNPITGLWVIIAENRAGRPQEIRLQPVTSERTVDCPFCEGQESRTPGEVLARRPAGSEHDSPGWTVRIVPNKFPAVSPASASDRNRPDGIHEVIVESPRHLTSITQLDDAQLAVVLDVYRERLARLHNQLPGGQAMLFKNNGPEAGATLSHLHSQLVASDQAHATPLGSDRATRFRSHADQFGTCPACQMIEEATGAGLRVAESPNFIAVCPYAARFPYETWILPRRHASHFSQTQPDSLPELAGLLRTVLVDLEQTIESPAYNYLLQTAPFDTSAADHYHWHIEILPRVTTLAGFELGTGCYINPVPPERAAKALART